MLDNPRASRVKQVAKLSQRGARLDAGLFLLEGPQSVAEALTYRPELIVELYATPTALDRYGDIAQAAVAAGVDVEFATEEVIDAMESITIPLPVWAIMRILGTEDRRATAGRAREIGLLPERKHGMGTVRGSPTRPDRLGNGGVVAMLAMQQRL